MAFDTDTIEPEVGETPPQTPPDTTGDAKLRLLHTAVGREYNLGTFDEFKQKIQNPEKRKKFYDAVGREYNLGTYDEFQTKLGFGNKPQAPATPSAQPPPEHEITHTPLQDIRHVQEMANLPLEMHVVDPLGGLKEATPESLARNKAYQDQFSKMATDLGTQWNAKPEVVKQVLQDFPDEQDEHKLQKNATLAVENPVSYFRLKNGDDIRMKIAKDGPVGIHDANVFNHLLDAQDYQQLTEENIPYQMQLMREHNLSQGDVDKLKDTQRSLINSMDQGLLGKYWNSKDKEYGLTPDEYAGLETERLFNPNKAQMDEAIIKHSRGIGEDGKPNPLDMSKQSYTYQRGVENVKYNLQQTGRENLARYVAEHKADTDKQAQALSDQYKQSLQFANPAEQNQLIQDFNNHPIIQEANKLQEASEALKYSEAEDYRRYPLNFADQATRAVADAMDHTSGLGKDALKLGGTFLQGAGETADNTMRFIKNTAINLLASDERKALNSAQNIGHQSLTELAAYQPVSYTGKESPILVPRETQQAVQNILTGPGSDADKQQRAISYIRDNFDQLTVNPKAGQQNLTGKAALFQAANVMGQIAGVANQSFLLGGAIGDASKLQQMVTAFTPMYASTQNQMYEQAIKNGEEHPLLKSTVDATILSLASLINPDIKVVKGMVGAETGLGKTIAGISEDAWNKVLSENKPVLDRLSGFAKATGRQLGLANLQYGIIAPVAQGIANKAILNEDANIPDMIKDGIIQTNISMALPALLHGVWSGLRATEVNPHQKYSIVEAGLHPDQNIDLIEDKIKSGAISEIQGHEMKQLVKHAGEILQNTEMVKTDGTPMNEKEVADVTYNMLRLRVLEGKLKTAAEPVKPLINEKIHEINKDISDLHTSESDKQRNELNQLLHDNLDKIKNKVPEFEQKVKDAIAANTPEEAFRVIADEANKTKKVEGKETSLRAEAEEKYGKALVDKAIELSKQKPAEKAPEETAKPKEGDVTDQKAALTIKPTSDKIQPTDQFRTWDLGDMEGKPEDAAAKKHIEGVVEAWDKHPAGETGGETFGSFIQRVIPAFDKSLKEDPNNTTIVTHSSVLKAFKVWDEMGRPDVASLSEEQKKQFADAYNKEETHNGDLETFKGANGEVNVIRHGQTEDNAKNNFRSGNTNLTEQGIQDAHNVGQQLAAKTGGDVPKVISSDLPRAVHTSNIITDKLSNNAIPERSPAGEVPRAGTAGENIPASSEGVGSSQQGQVPTEEGGNPQAQPNGGEVPPGKEVNPDDLPFGNLPVAIAHELHTMREKADLGLAPTERGEGITLQESIDRGNELLKEGIDIDKIVSDFQKDKKLSSDTMAAVRARYTELAGKTDKAYDQFGSDSPEAKAARAEETAFYRNAVKPMQTEWSKIGVAQQGAIDIDTGTVTGMARAFSEIHGKEFSPEQEAKAKELSEKVKSLDKEVNRLKEKLDKAFEGKAETKEVGVKEKAQNLAKKIRDNAKLNRPGMFSAATPASLVWDGAVEVVAKAVEAGGVLADAIGKGIEHIKESDWYKGLSDKDKQTAESQFADWHMEQGREKTQLAEQFVNKSPKDNKFTIDEAKAIWNYVKTKYMDKETPFPDALKATANDLGLSMQQVLHAIATPKGAKEITDEMFKKQYERNKAINYAKRFVKTANQPAAIKFFNNLPSAFFTLKTYGHGTVGNITHAGPNIFRPSVWKAYWPNVFKSFSLAYGSKANYEKAVTILETSPHFLDWKRAGLAVDPREGYDDFQIFGKKQSWLGEAGTRGFTGLKFMRHDMAETFYNRLSDSEKADPNIREEIAKLVNHATGHSEVKVNVRIGKKSFDPLRTIAFAPGLEVSRWQRMITDPARAISTFSKWAAGKEPSPAEMAAMKIVARGAGERLATYTALLAANAGLLSALNTKQQINLTDPTQSDWLKFKVEGKTIDFTGNILSPIRLLSVIGKGMYLTKFGNEKDLRTKPGDKDASTLAQQARYKLSPLAGTVADVATGTDAMGNILPWSHVKPSTGRYKMTWPDYAWQQLPIPLAAGYNAYQESMRERGVPHSMRDAWLNGALQFTVEGFTGVKMTPDYDLEKGGGNTGGGGAGGYYGR